MRTLFEIISSAKDGEMPTHEECYWAMLAYEAMLGMDHSKLRRELTREKPSPEFIKKMDAENSHRMYHNALNKHPKDWLGPNWDPSNPEYQKFRKIGNKLLDKVIAKQTKEKVD